MKAIITIFGIFLILSGISLFFAPDLLFDFLDNYKGHLSVYILAIAVRIGLGILLLKFAHTSTYPLAIKILACFFIIAAVVFVFIGHENFQALIAYVIPVFKPYTRIVGLLSIAFGGFFLYAFTIKSTKGSEPI